MNSLFSIVHYEKLHTQILNVLRKIAKKNTASISFSIYLSLKSPPTLIRIYGLSMCFSFKILSRQILEIYFVLFQSNPIHRPWCFSRFSDHKSSQLPNRYRSDLRSVFLLYFSRCIQIKFWLDFGQLFSQIPK